MSLKMKEIKTKTELEKLYNFNVEVFTEMADFEWSLEGLQGEMKNGWEVYSVSVDEEIIAAILLKEENSTLFTKHTPIKLEHRGNAYSHEIKDFIEQIGVDRGVSEVINMCRGDNFRVISLNETHGYERTGKISPDGNFEEWRKKINAKK